MMRKVVFSLGFFALTIASCSDNEKTSIKTDEEVEKEVLLKERQNETVQTIDTTKLFDLLVLHINQIYKENAAQNLDLINDSIYGEWLSAHYFANGKFDEKYEKAPMYIKKEELLEQPTVFSKFFNKSISDELVSKINKLRKNQTEITPEFAIQINFRKHQNGIVGSGSYNFQLVNNQFKLISISLIPVEADL